AAGVILTSTPDGLMDAANWNENTGERRARKHASGVRRGVRGKGLVTVPRLWPTLLCHCAFREGGTRTRHRKDYPMAQANGTHPESEENQSHTYPDPRWGKCGL